jgi:hypothetical protein
MAVSKMNTEALILDVVTERNKTTLTCDIGAIQNSPVRFIPWKLSQGLPPAKGSTVLAEMNPTRKWTEPKGPVTGVEEPQHCNWEMLSYKPLGNSPQPTENVAVTPSSSTVGASSGGEKPVYVDGNLRLKVDSQGVNDRKAVSDILALAEPGTYTLDGLIEDAEKLASWYNNRFIARISGGLTGKAQEEGAVVKSVSEPKADEPIPDFKNEEVLRQWVKEKKWETHMPGILEKAGYHSSQEYYETTGHTPQTLGQLIIEAMKIEW